MFETPSVLELAELFPLDAKSTIKNICWNYKSGKVLWYSKHKTTTSRDWQQYANLMIDYPHTIMVKDEEYHVVDMACGLRDRRDKLLLIRELSPDYVYGLLVGNDGNIWDRFYDQIIFFDMMREKFYSLVTADPVDTTDENFHRYWMSSVDELIHKNCWHEGHADNSIRKLVRQFAYYRSKEQTEATESIADKLERRLDVNMCGRCYKRTCCCDRHSSRELSYTVNPHAMTIEVCKDHRSMEFTLEEVAELASFFASAKTKIKEAKVAELEAQAAELAKQLEEAKSI